jgi:hypothetical protein
VAVLGEVGERVGLVELEGVVRLRVDVDADDLEPGSVVADGRAAGAGVQIEDPHKVHCSS